MRNVIFVICEGIGKVFEGFFFGIGMLLAIYGWSVFV